MDAAALKDLFAPFGPVTVKRMFGGHGIYAEGLCFAMEDKGAVYIKVDASSEKEFAAVGSGPFVYQMKGEARSMAYWRLPADGYEGHERLKHWAALGLRAARAAAAGKGKRLSAGKPAKAKAGNAAAMAAKPRA